uniref:Uncharacterized protein n=1 Tax=Caenorhabditis tropicalis TaxID=1561998 RepID=A0A1I7UVQ0_9PELO
MSEHFKFGLLGDNCFETPKKVSDRNLYETPPESSVSDDNEQWNYSAYTDFNSSIKHQSPTFFATPQSIPFRNTPTLSSPFPGYSPISRSWSSSTTSSTTSSRQTPNEKEPSSSAKPKTILEKLLEEDSPKTKDRSSSKPPPRQKRKYTRRMKHSYPPQLRIYEENWLNEVYWISYDDFIRNYYTTTIPWLASNPEDKVARPPNPSESTPNQGLDSPF